MKKLMALMVGLCLTFGTVAVVFADDAPAESKQAKGKGKGKGKTDTGKKGAKDRTEAVKKSK